MAVDSQFRMPGAFHSEGVHPGIFRPPPRRPGRTPSSSGYLPSRVVSDEGINAKRKRHQDDRFSRPAAAGSGADDYSEQYTTPRANGWGSAKRYLLAGQVDYSGGDTGDVLMGESMYSDSDYRRELGTRRTKEDAETNGPVRSIFPSSSAQEEAYQSQQSQLAMQSSQKSSSWGSFAVSALGGVVGRIWQFCTTTNFKGFHAGGGIGYEIRQSLADDSIFQDDFFDNHQHPHRSVPGYFPPPADELEDPFACASRDSSPAAPPAKRRQMAGMTNDLKKDWVFIDNSGESLAAQRNNQASNATAPPRSRNSRPSMVTGRRISTPSTRRTQASRPSMASTPSVMAPSAPATTASTASFASPRSQSPSKIPVYTPPSSMSTSRQSTSRRRTTTTPGAVTHKRTNSGASMASGRASVRHSQGSFSSDKHQSQHEYVDSSPRLSNEARKLAARRRREEEDADERMSMMGNQLQDMIRQAKEALGTTIEVDGDVDGGGWEDEVY